MDFYSDLKFDAYFARLGLWVRAEPAEVFADLLALWFLRDLDAAEAARPDATLAGAFRWESAEPAADLADLLAPLLLRIFEAAEAARLPVTSLFFDIFNYLDFALDMLAELYRGDIVQYQKSNND